MGVPLPNEIHLLIANYIYYSRGFGAKNHSQYSNVSKTTKCIMDSLAKKDGFSDYLHRSLYYNDRCNDCHCKVSTRIDDFFDKNYKLCGSCNSKRPKLSPTQIKKDYLLKEHEFIHLPHFTTRNQYKVYCNYFLQSDIDELQSILYTQEEIDKFHYKKQRRIERKFEIEQEKYSRLEEINLLLSRFPNWVVSAVKHYTPCVDYIQKNVPKNKKKKEEFINSLIEKASYYTSSKNYKIGKGDADIESKKRIL